MSKEAKLLRGQLRQVVKENIDTLLGQELAEKLYKDLLANQNARLDQLEKTVTNQLQAMDKRAKAVQGFMMNQVINDITGRMYESQVTMDAVIRVLAESGLLIENLNEKIAAKKTEIKEEHRKEAEAKAAEQTKPEMPNETKPEA